MTNSTLSSSKQSYPLNCYDSFNDGYSGWYPISNKDVCTDFCFWEPIEETPKNQSTYTADNTADPHQTTFIPNKARWKCLYDVSDDQTLFNGSSITRQQQEKKNIIKQSSDDEFTGKNKFDYLRCNRNANEKIHTASERLIQSSLFWFMLWFGCIILIALEFYFFLVVRRRKKRSTVQFTRLNSVDISLSPLGAGGNNNENNNEQNLPPELVPPSLALSSSKDTSRKKRSSVTTTRTSNTSTREWTEGETRTGGLDDDEENDLEDNESPLSSTADDVAFRENNDEFFDDDDDEEADESHVRRRVLTLKQQIRWYCLVLLLVIVNIGIVVIAFTATISLIEISGPNRITPYETKLTPQCIDHMNICRAANHDIDRTKTNKRSSNDKTATDAKPFSYLIASDVQLNWWWGESATLGKTIYPKPCTKRDSCYSCTKKAATYTNQQMKKSIELLIKSGDTNNTDGSSDSTVVPKTLVINGDLTSYFHPYEKERYESFYHNIEGLESYFPSLGNHDYDHVGSGAHYDTDQWYWGEAYCNEEHSIAYMKGGLCNKIPKFNPNRIVRYDSKSLAYSWNEGKYHFVHLHYYPAYENSKLRISSSIQWLTKDLLIAKENKLKSILFVHAPQGMNHVMEKVVMDKDVVAVFSGHVHRCLHRKCVGLYHINEREANTTATGKDDDSKSGFEKCIPANLPTCGGSTNSINNQALIYVKDLLKNNITLQEFNSRDYKIYKSPPDKHSLCRQPTPAYVNDTDNTLLCKEVMYAYSDFTYHDSKNVEQSIPIFFSGSSSFETFLKADFYTDRIVVNTMTAAANQEGQRYVDVNDVPNAVYPHHDRSDLEEVTIYL